MSDTFDDAVDGLLDAGAEALADIRQDWDRQKQLIEAQARQTQTDLDALLAPLRERLAKLEGQVSVLLGGDAVNNSARSKRAKQSQNNGRLLEHKPTQ
jgi:hypothetical protein